MEITKRKTFLDHLEQHMLSSARKCSCWRQWCCLLVCWFALPRPTCKIITSLRILFERWSQFVCSYTPQTKYADACFEYSLAHQHHAPFVPAPSPQRRSSIEQEIKTEATRSLQACSSSRLLIAVASQVGIMRL